MDLRIIKSFGVPECRVPFDPGDCVTLPDSEARKWIAEGKAIKLNPSAPVKRKREKATRF